MINRVFTIATLFLLLSMSACAPEAPVEVDADVGSLYVAPTTYQDHRNQQQLFETQGGHIAYTDTGEGEALVLLHGVPTSSWLFRKIIPQLQKHMRVISVDLLGYGSSDKPENDGVVYMSDEQAKRVQALMTHLGVERYGVLMHDMGGLVAWELLALYPDNIAHFVVLDTIINVKGFNHPNIDPGPFTKALMTVYSDDLTSAEMLKQTFDGFGLKGKYALTEAESFGYVEPMREGADQALYAFYTHVNTDLFKKLDAYETNFRAYGGDALVLWGGLDKVLTAEQIPILRHTMNIPDDNIHIYEDNGHFLSEEVPDEISEKIVTFMFKP